MLLTVISAMPVRVEAQVRMKGGMGWGAGGIGIMEGLEFPSVPFCLAVQWHPEDLQEGEPNQALFDAVLQAACTYRQGRAAV